MWDSDSDGGSTSIHKREQQRLMLRFMLGLLYKVFPGARPIVEGAAQVLNRGYRIYLILMLPFIVLIEVIIAYDFVYQLRVVQMDKFQVFGLIFAFFVVRLLIVWVSRDAFRVAAAIKYHIKK